MSRFDSQAFKNLVQGDRQLALELLDLFEKDWPELIRGIRKSLAQAEPAQVERLSHRLKGNVRNFYAKHATELAQKLEEQGRLRDLSALNDVLTLLEAELQELQKEIRIFLQQM